MSKEFSVFVDMDRVDALLMNHPDKVPSPPVVHRFTPGMYIREITMPKGVIGTSKIHKTTHPFVISKGCVSVWSKETGVVTMRAPFTGVTTPGTRRILYMHEETVWTTFHPNPTNETDLAKVEDFIIQKYDHGKIESADAESLQSGMDQLLALTGMGKEQGELK